MIRRAHAVVAAVLLLTFALPARAQRLDGIAAVVDNEVILQSDVEEQLQLFIAQSGLDPDSVTVDSLRKQVLDRLIEEKLIVGEADKQKITVSDDEVTKEVDNAMDEARQRLGSEEAFQRQLRAEGLTEDKLRDRYMNDLRHQMIARRLVQKQIPMKTVTQTEAEAYFKAHREKFPKAPPEANLSVILIAVEPDSANVAAARTKALAALKRIKGGEKFAKVAQDVSEDPGSAKAGGDLGYFGRGRMTGPFENAVFALPLGKVSDPIRSDFGWHIIEVLDRDTLKTHPPKGAPKDSLDQDGKPAIECHARHILIRTAVTQADADRARKLCERVRSEVLKGTDFASLARRYSKLEGSNPDGSVGWMSYSKLNLPVRTAIDTTEIGHLSAIVQGPSGYSFFKVSDKKPEHEYQLDEIKAELPQAVAQLQFQERYKDWVKTLRAKAHVEVRG